MPKLSPWKMAIAYLALLAVTVIGASAQVFSTLVNLNGSDGRSPISLLQGHDGSLYGITEFGGASDQGTVFVTTPTGVLTTLHSFDGIDGSYPVAGLVLGTDGKFYGTTELGGGDGCTGSLGCGTVFKVTSQGELDTLHDFDGSDGANPVAALVQATDGKFYGTTGLGGGTGCGGFGCGTLFEITAAGGLTTPYTFCAKVNCIDGQDPEWLVQGTDGNLYGTAAGGGTHGGGTVFRFSRRGVVTTLYNFCSKAQCADGEAPETPLLQDPINGTLYGTTHNGGNTNNTYCSTTCGTIFKITPAGKLTTLYRFCAQANCSDGGIPDWLILATDGNFYGTTARGVNSGCNGVGCGTIFRFTPDGILTTLHTFNMIDGAGPGELYQSTSGDFYGVTARGGLNDVGTIYRLSVGLGPFVTFVRAAGKVGQTGPILGQGFTGTTSVLLNGTPTSFTVVSDTYIRATVPVGATTGYVTVTTPSGTLTSNVPFRVIR